MRRNPPRRRNASATRSAILASALRAFSRAGYEGVGVREIAKGAGVTAVLINRYFGSKEQLFAKVVAETMATPSILTPEILSSQTPGKDRLRAGRAHQGGRQSSRRLSDYASLDFQQARRKDRSRADREASSAYDDRGAE
jgi:AcrR family transcriptional regulator